jgi:ATP-dependent RNA helicase SUPV3L1/SUV3
VIRHYFDEDPFDEGITRVSEMTLVDLVQSLGVIPDAWDKAYLVRLLRRLWSDAQLELRQDIVAFFKAQNKVYEGTSQQKSNNDRSEKIFSLLEEIDDLTKEEVFELHKAYMDVRTKKINLYKIQSSLQHLRFDKKKHKLEKELDGMFDLDDRFEFNASFQFQFAAEMFSKILILKTPLFSYSYLSENDHDTLLVEIKTIQKDLKVIKQNEIDDFLHTIQSAHENTHRYLSDIEILKALRQSPPLLEIPKIPLKKNQLFSLLPSLLQGYKLQSIDASESEIILGVETSYNFEFAKETIEYLLYFTLDAHELYKQIWQEEDISFEETIAREQHNHEQSFAIELDTLYQHCKKTSFTTSNA